MEVEVEVEIQGKSRLTSVEAVSIGTEVAALAVVVTLVHLRLEWDKETITEEDRQ